MDQSGSAAGWHSVVPARGRLAGLADSYIVYSVVPVWAGPFYREIGMI